MVLSTSSPRVGGRWKEFSSLFWMGERGWRGVEDGEEGGGVEGGCMPKG